MEIGKSWETVQTGGGWRVWKEWEIKCSQRCYTVGTHYPPHELVLQWADSHCNLHAALYRHLQRVAVLLKQEVPPLWCSSTDHKHSHGDVDREAENRRLSIQLHFISIYYQHYVSSDYRQYLCGRLTSKFLKSKGDCRCALFGRWPLTSCRHQSPSTCWRAGWLWSRREGSSWRSWTAAGSSSALAQTLIQSQSTLADQSAPGTDPQCSPEK